LNLTVSSFFVVFMQGIILDRSNPGDIKNSSPFGLPVRFV